MYWSQQETINGFKVAKHSFQVPMPNSPLLLNYLCFGAHFLQEIRLIIYYRSIYSRILTRVCAVAMATGLVKNQGKIIVFDTFKIIQSLECFHLLHTTN